MSVDGGEGSDLLYAGDDIDAGEVLEYLCRLVDKSLVVAEPARIIESATVSAYRKPEQTACTSKAAQPWMPSLACSRQAVLGNTISGVMVATTTAVLPSLPFM